MVLVFDPPPNLSSESDPLAGLAGLGPRFGFRPPGSHRHLAEGPRDDPAASARLECGGSRGVEVFGPRGRFAGE